MKKIIIGRNDACDIIIPDTTDMVSRKQAVLAFSFWGKMVLYDTSNNGTYLNGERIENGKGKRVTRKDKVSFAHVADLDWNTVRDPYLKEKRTLALAFVIVLIAAAAATWWLTQPDKAANVKKADTTELAVELDGKQAETEDAVTTTPADEQPAQTQQKKKKRKKADDNQPKDEVSRQSPIIN